jgi:hypothetical protein
MLNKKLCYKCFVDDCKNVKHYIFNDDEVKEQIAWFLELWRIKSKCACPVRNEHLNIKKQPPKHCPYLLEHAVSNQGGEIC